MILSREEMAERIFYGPVEGRLDLARMLFETQGPQLLQDTALAGRLDTLKDRAADLSRHMTEMDMGSLCGRCARSAGGGCCSSGMAQETDTLQLLMNMLVGIGVGVVRSGGDDCCFLGETGCLFLFKPMFCLNYNCRRITTAASDDALHRLTTLTGRLLGEQYEAEKCLLDLIESSRA